MECTVLLAFLPFAPHDYTAIPTQACCPLTHRLRKYAERGYAAEGSEPIARKHPGLRVAGQDVAEVAEGRQKLGVAGQTKRSH